MIKIKAKKGFVQRNRNYSMNQLSLKWKMEVCSSHGSIGCGKSTLLNIMGLLDNPSAGDYLLDNEEVGHLGEGTHSGPQRENRVCFSELQPD